jgi:NAD(P)-dependent dehydrogenase (short-subunit alcohol dehydrogenase family)
VTIADIQEQSKEGGEITSKIINDNQGDCLFVNTDVTSKRSVENLIKKTIEKFSEINILVNCAGIYIRKPFDEIDVEEYDKIMDINTKGLFFTSQLVIKQMMKQGKGGCIVNISSLAGLYGREYESIYCVSKAGVSNLTRALAVEYGKYNIRINAINPSTVETSMNPLKDTFIKDTPLGRNATPLEVARVAVFLSSEDSSYITGQNIIVDGGLSAK